MPDVLISAQKYIKIESCTVKTVQEEHTTSTTCIRFFKTGKTVHAYAIWVLTLGASEVIGPAES